MAIDLTFILILILIFIVTTLPLHLAVNMFGGRTTFLKTFLVILVSSIIVAFITSLFPLGGLIAFIVLIWIYSEMFHIGMLRAFFIWIMQFIIVIIFAFILALAGISFLTLDLLF